MYTFQAMQILIFLIPGFIAVAIMDALIVRAEDSEFRRVIEALILSLVIYTFYTLVPDHNPIELTSSATTVSLSYRWGGFLWLAIFTIIIPLILSFAIINGLHKWCAEKIRLNVRKNAARNFVWYDVLSSTKNDIIINFENGRRITGFPKYFSDRPDKPYIYLIDPAWIVMDDKSKEQEYVPLDVTGIMITPEQAIESIEFLKPKSREEDA